MLLGVPCFCAGPQSHVVGTSRIKTFPVQLEIFETFQGLSIRKFVISVEANKI